MKTEVVSANINNHLQYKHKLLKVAREKKNSTSWWFSHIKEKHMKEKVITKIINEMLPSLNNEQLKKLKDAGTQQGVYG